MGDAMDLGAFSVSLAVADLAASRAFYEKLGFTPFAGDPDQGWQILKNGDAVIGLFQGMFDANILTFNPGWNSDGQNRDPFTDIRELQAAMRERGLEPLEQVDETGSGPGYLTLQDPDGNQILLDQHR